MQQVERSFEPRIETSVFPVNEHNCSRVTLSSDCASKRNKPAWTSANHSREEKKNHIREELYTLCIQGLPCNIGLHKAFIPQDSMIAELSVHMSSQAFKTSPFLSDTCSTLPPLVDIPCGI